MEFKDIASISGKPGLYKIIKPTRTGVVIESLDEKKKRGVAGMNNRVSVLQEVSIYSENEEGSTALREIYQTIFEKYGTSLPVEPKSQPEDLMAFLEEVLPNYEREKVYASDVKKMISWYLIICKFTPETLEKLNDPEEEEVEEKKEPKETEQKVSPKKTTAEKKAEKPVEVEQKTDVKNATAKKKVEEATEVEKEKKTTAKKTTSKKKEEATDTESTEAKPKRNTRKKKTEEETKS